MGNFNFVPAEVPGACSTNKRISGHFKDGEKDLTWWKKESLFKYPYILISAHYGMKKENIRKLLKIKDDIIFMGDSGGFQNMSLKEWKGQDIEIDPKEVFDWQVENCDIGFPLDYPPFDADEKAWKKSMNISNENFKIAEDLYTKYLESNPERPLKLYNIFQGYGFNKRKMDDWYNMASKYPNMTKTGWSFGCKPEAKPMLLAYQGMYMYNKGHSNNFHFLAVSGSRTIPVLAYLARYVDNITADSSAWAQGSMQRKYFLPLYFGKMELFFGQANKANIKNIPCMCPVCSQIDSINMLSSQGSAPGGIISLHNLYQLIQYTKLCNSLKDDKEVYRNFIRKFFDKEVQLAIEFIDYSLDKGFDKACVKFQSHFSKDNGKVNTAGLLDY